MSAKGKKKVFLPGDVYAIPLKSGGYAFGAVCIGNEFIFFDLHVDSSDLPKDILNRPIVFRVPVAIDGPNMGRWPHVGKIELPDEYSKPGKYLHKPVGSEQYYIYSAGREIAVSKEECKGLEILSTWFSIHIERRLDDYFSGGGDKYTMAIKKQLGIDV